MDALTALMRLNSATTDDVVVYECKEYYDLPTVYAVGSCIAQMSDEWKIGMANLIGRGLRQIVPRCTVPTEIDASTIFQSCDGCGVHISRHP